MNKTCKTNRERLLAKLQSVSPGLSSKAALLQQSDCFVLKDGAVYTFNDDCSGKAPLKLDPPIQGAVNADKLMEVLRRWNSEEIALKSDGDRFIVMAPGGRKAKIIMEAEIHLPIEDVEKPKDWKPVSEEFVEAVNACQMRGNKGDDFVFNCLHIHPKWIESCDTTQVCRWTLETGLKKPALVKQDMAKRVVALGVTEMSETEVWLHFKTHDGAILSLKKHLGFEFKDIGNVLANSGQGEKISLPKGLSEAVENAQIMSSENVDSDRVRVDLKSGLVVIIGEGVKGEISEPRKIPYKGKELSFYIYPKILSMIVDKFPEAIIGDGTLRAQIGNLVYITCLLLPSEMQDSNEEGEKTNEY